MGWLRDYAGRTVSFRHAGQDFRFLLSQSLFSSYDIDRGSRLLLKSIAQHIDVAPMTSALDVGCGVGVLGICLGKQNPNALVTFQDRDALACEFTRTNARVNQVGNARIAGALALEGIPGERFDLIVSNVPAKAGKRVLEDFFRRVPGFLTPRGVAACVIVSPLGELARAVLSECNATVLHEETNGTHDVYHFACESEAAPHAILDTYSRGSHVFHASGTDYTLATVLGLPEFDTPSYRSSLAQNMSGNADVGGELLVWNPGQGHLPAFLWAKKRDAIRGISLAGRDILSLKATSSNLENLGMNPALIRSLHVASSHLGFDTIGAYDFVAAFPDLEIETRALFSVVPSLLRKGGIFLVAAKSSLIYRVLSERHPFTVLSDRRNRGVRCVLLKPRSTHPA